MLSILVKAMGRRPVSSLEFTAVQEPCRGVQAWPVKKWDKGALGKQTGSPSEQALHSVCARTQPGCAWAPGAAF